MQGRDLRELARALGPPPERALVYNDGLAVPATVCTAYLYILAYITETCQGFYRHDDGLAVPARGLRVKRRRHGNGSGLGEIYGVILGHSCALRSIAVLLSSYPSHALDAACF